MSKTPQQLRNDIRNESITHVTSGMADGYLQANLVIVPKKDAGDFKLFCDRNPEPCPLLEMLPAGEFLTSKIAEQADLRTDIPKYRVFKNGEVVDEPLNIVDYWQDDFVSFLLGCSFSFEAQLKEVGVALPHTDTHAIPPIFQTNIETTPVGKFAGPLVVSMRCIPNDLIEQVIKITRESPQAHGAPIHIGPAAVIGIKDLGKPMFGEAVFPKENETAAFWACGITPQAVAVASKIELMITHYPGSMFISDRTCKK